MDALAFLIAPIALTAAYRYWFVGYRRQHQLSEYSRVRDEVKVVTLHFDMWGHAFTGSTTERITDRQHPLHIQLRTQYDEAETRSRQILAESMRGLSGKAFSN